MTTGTEIAHRGAAAHPDVGHLTDVNRDVLRILGKPGWGWWALLTVALLGVGMLFGSWGLILWKGFGLTGLTAPEGWGSLITTFVFWVGIAHSGTLISAILFLFRAPWRQSVYRIAEAMTVFAVMTPTGSSRTRTAASSGRTSARRWSGTCSR
jgi:hypothetical protein